MDPAGRFSRRRKTINKNAEIRSDPRERKENMKKLLACAMIAGLALGSFAADVIYRGNSKDAKDAVCYFQGGKFFEDAARKKQIYHHPGNMVSKEARATAKNSIYRLMGGRIYKGFSIKPEDCIATIFETKTRKGNTVEARIYAGVVFPRDVVEKNEKGTKTITSFKLTSDNKNTYIDPKPLFTIANNKIYRGDSTDDKDCVLSYTGNFNSSRLLFIAVELAK